MKRFKFRFKAVEKFRTQLERDSLRDMAQAKKDYILAMQEKEKLKGDLQSSLVRRENLNKVVSGISSFVMENSFISGTKERIKKAEEKIARQKENYEKKLSLYLVRRKDRKAMEKLHERDREKYKKTRSKYEDKAQDNQYTMRASRMRKEW